jgi:DNA helicase-2/ATP-dependent DNA helicase PcrA
MSVAYLEKLNTEQRQAAEHAIGEKDTTPGMPLLVIAGAGSGKTNTLAHRVAHLIVNGADPRRILLMTAACLAAEMTRRVERIARQVIGDNADIMTGAMTWAGTFHGIGARLLREYAEQISLYPNFTIHDREDAADLMNLLRHELGFSKTESRFPTKGTCLAIYSRCINAEAEIEDVCRTNFPWCSAWDSELKKLFAAYIEAKQHQNVLDYDDLLLYWAQMVSDPGLAQDIGSRFDHILVDEYQDTANRLQASILLALKPTGRGLTVVGDDAQSPMRSARRPCGTSSTFLASSARQRKSSRSTEIIAPHNRYSQPPTPSSISQPSASPKISGRTETRLTFLSLSAFATKPIRRITSSNAS